MRVYMFVDCSLTAAIISRPDSLSLRPLLRPQTHLGAALSRAQSGASTLRA
jgi:hypothetical protein